MATGDLKKRGRYILIVGILLFSFMLLSFIFMRNALEDSERFGNLFLYLLVFNAIGLIVLIVLIVLNFKRLRRELVNQVPGAFMTLRMVMMFSVLSITPVLIVYYFSLDFLLRGIDNWFDLRVEQALDDSLELSKLSLDSRMQEHLKQTQQVADELSQTTDAALPFEIDELRNRISAEELTVLTRQGGIIASSSGDISNLVPRSADEAMLLQLQQGKSFAGLDPTGESDLFIRIAVNIPVFEVDSQARVVMTLFPVNDRINNLANNVQSAFVDYQELSYLREQLKLSFVMILTLVLLFSIFSVIWAAFYSAKKLAEPVRDLAKGTRAIAQGNYDMRLPVTSRDELGFLVASFNDMTNQIAKARDEIKLSQELLESQRTRLATILEKLTSGVLVFDHRQYLIAANNSSSKILENDLPDHINESLPGLIKLFPALENLFQVIRDQIESDQVDWREQIELNHDGSKQELMCSGTVLQDNTGTNSGYVVVFDDITALIQGQRDAAWSEMARRLAHEIKNPLTPIQLAAERLRIKYLDQMPSVDAEILDRLTNTIIQQVETMKSMVNDFSEYSHTPRPEISLQDIEKLIREVSDLYVNNEKHVTINLNQPGALPKVKLDPKRIRQVFNNLLQNALEASHENGRIEIELDMVFDQPDEYIQIIIRDEGKGIDEAIQQQIFEPYVTSKQKGTGLGLAIVKKIIDEHDGFIWIKNNPDHIGAQVTIQLPVHLTEMPVKYPAEDELS